jgi:hypothetical protein
MVAGQWLILVIIGTPLLILARDAYNRRHRPKEVLLALGVLAAIAINLAVSLHLR